MCVHTSYSTASCSGTHTHTSPSPTQLYFADEPKKGRSFESLYELVQHAGNVLPRLYLMCTVGTCFIRSKEGFAKDVLRDLAEMCKGVQHPTRGLFLRSYLCQVGLGVGGLGVGGWWMGGGWVYVLVNIVCGQHTVHSQYM